ncbi:MAG: 50S ribosomal protein L24 [Chlamydiales bacterium]
MKKTLLCKDDEVVVIAGNDKGKVGKIISINHQRVVIEGVNLRKKHMKPTKQNQKGQIIDIECSIDISNIKPSVGGEVVKLRKRFNKQGKKEIYYLRDQKEHLYRSRSKKN